MDRVVLELVNEIVQIHEGVVDGGHLSLASVFLNCRAEGETTDAAKAIDSNSDCGHLWMREIFKIVIYALRTN
jgi:hypothetical protein